jgi:bacterioferritin-associated ferredoxin
MVVCVCKGLTETQLRSLIQGGSDTLERLTSASGAGADCGECCEVLCWMLNAKSQEWAPDVGLQRCSHAAHGDPRPNAHSSIQGADREVPPPRTDR